MPTHYLEQSVERCVGIVDGTSDKRHPAVYYAGEYCPACQLIEQAEQIEALQNRVFDTEDQRDAALAGIDQLKAMLAAVAREAGHVA